MINKRYIIKVYDILNIHFINNNMISVEIVKEISFRSIKKV